MIDEVLNDLKDLSRKGPVSATTMGSNAVGKTLQSCLGIAHSTTSRNKYKGFTITATTASGNNRTNLFAQVPDWKISELCSSKELVDRYGTKDESGKYERSLFCTVTARQPNTFGLMLKVDRPSQKLEEIYNAGGVQSRVATWDSEKLASKLRSLDKSVIVSAKRLKDEGGISFHYRYAEFFMAPSFDEFLSQVEAGAITLDHLVSLRHGSNAAREQGPLFKVSKSSRVSLFGEYQKFDLMA